MTDNLPPTPPAAYLEYDRQFYAGAWYYRKSEISPWMRCKVDTEEPTRSPLIPSLPDRIFSLIAKALIYVAAAIVVGVFVVIGTAFSAASVFDVIALGW